MAKGVYVIAIDLSFPWGTRHFKLIINVIY